jgi:hypothetical protein
MKAFVAILFLGLTICELYAREESAAGVYRSEVGIYSLTLSLLSNGNYLARWDADIGSNGSASGSWTLVAGEVRVVPKKEEGHPMTGYLRVLLLREFEGRKVSLRKEDAAHEKNPFFYLYLQKPNKAPEPTPTAVTSRADRFSECTIVRKARLAPAAVVAHL